MGISAGPDIITDGLVLELDAGDRNSYPGTGTTWRDLSGNSNNGTLTNGPTFNTGSLGNIVFDGADDRVTFSSYPSLNSTQTKNLWINCTNLVAGNNRYLIDEGGNLNWVQLYAISGQPGVRAGFDGSANNFLDSTARINANQWYNICVTSTTSGGNISIYINGILDSTTTGKTPSNSTGLLIGNYGGGGSYYYIGNMAIAQIYNRALSATEVSQNYTAMKTRFGL